VPGVAFSRDGKRLASAGADGSALVWDVHTLALPGGAPPTRLPPPALEALWTDLAGEDAATAHRAVAVLVALPGQALPFLKARLRPATLDDRKQIAPLLKDLDSDRFPVREKATRELARLGELAAPALRRASAADLPPEVRRRVEHLLDKLDGPVTGLETRRALRATEVLEHIGNAEARGVLETLTQGVPEARLTQEAKASLQRLARHAVRAP
jgi:hypothetical protein